MLIPAAYYHTIYLTLVTLMTFVAYAQYQSHKGTRMFKSSRTEVIGVVLVLFLILFIGFRPISNRYFVDMPNYVTYYTVLYEGVPFFFRWDTDNLIFDNLFAWWGSERLGYTSFFVCMAAIYFGAAYLGIRKIFPNHKFTAYLVFLAAFSTFSYSTNGIKAGAATSLCILAMGYREKLVICIPLVLLSWGLHHSMIMVVSGFVLTLFVKSPKYYFIVWSLCFLMAAAHITTFQHLFSGFTTEHGAGYLLTEGGQHGGKGGFRLDFILYSAIPVLVGWYAVFKKKMTQSSLYRDLLNLYLCLNGVWMLCMYANYTNRIAYLSWFLYPIVLIYPFLEEQWGRSCYKTFSLVMLGHLGFTLFMNIFF